jgi:hypothetical protein
MTNYYQTFEYENGKKSGVILCEGKIMASCIESDHKARTEMIRKYKPINAAVDCPMYKVY